MSEAAKRNHHLCVALREKWIMKYMTLVVAVARAFTQRESERDNEAATPFWIRKNLYNIVLGMFTSHSNYNQINNHLFLI